MQNLEILRLACRILKFRDLTCGILKFQFLACRILKFQEINEWKQCNRSSHQNRERKQDELPFPKTSGTVTGNRGKRWPIVDRHFPSYNPRNKCGNTFWFPVMDPDLVIREGPGHPDPEITGSPVLKNFYALRASVWSDNKGGGGGGRAPRAPPLDPPLNRLLVALI